MIRIGILGGAGYTAGELIRLLINHPQAEIKFVNSESNAGNLLTDVHEGLYGETTMRFTSEMPFDEVDVAIFCFGHGKSEAFLKEHTHKNRGFGAGLSTSSNGEDCRLRRRKAASNTRSARLYLWSA